MTTVRSALGASPGSTTAEAPPANRLHAPGWRDPRIVVGVVIVALCVLLGARVLAAADDTVPVWALRRDLPAGATLQRADLVPVRVKLGAGTTRYLPATTALASGTTLTHDVAQDELLPRSAITSDAGRALVEVPLSVAPDDLPESVREGAVVDVWVTPKVAGSAQSGVRARLALDDVVVVGVPATGDSLAPQTTRQVIVGVDPDGSADLAEALGLLADGRVVLTRQARS